MASNCMSQLRTSIGKSRGGLRRSHREELDLQTRYLGKVWVRRSSHRKLELQPDSLLGSGSDLGSVNQREGSEEDVKLTYVMNYPALPY